MITVVVLHEAVNSHQVDDLLHPLRSEFLVHLAKPLVGIPLAQYHLVGDRNFIFGDELSQAPVLGIGCFDAPDLVLDVVRDLTGEFGIFRFEILFPVMPGDGFRILVKYFWHGLVSFLYSGNQNVPIRRIFLPDPLKPHRYLPYRRS